RAEVEVGRDLRAPQVRARLPDAARGPQVLRGGVRIRVLPALPQLLALTGLRVLRHDGARAVEAHLDARVARAGEEARRQPGVTVGEVLAGDDALGDRLRLLALLVRVLPVLRLLGPVAPLGRVHAQQQLVVVGLVAHGVALAALGSVELEGEDAGLGGVGGERVRQAVGVEAARVPAAGDRARDDLGVRELIDARISPFRALLTGHQVLLRVG